MSAVCDVFHAWLIVGESYVVSADHRTSVSRGWTVNSLITSGGLAEGPTMKVMRTFTVLAALVAGPALADCTVPDGSVQIPSGAAATREQMVAAQQAVKAYDNAVRAYADCLQQQKATTGDNPRLAEEYDRRSDAEVDKLQRLADKFNAELRAFKARNTG
jgi:hypothetical protein